MFGRFRAHRRSHDGERGERGDRGEHRHARGGFGWGGRHHGWHGRGVKPGRVFDHGDLRYVILHLIAEKPSHGYELIKAIEEKLGGTYSPSPGVVYPTLTMLEELGYATVAATEGNKKQYTITPEGLAFLAANQASVDAVLVRIEQAGGGGRGEAGPAPQLFRAMENLRLALRLRMQRGSLTQEQIQRIAAAIDAAAVEAERT